MQGLHITADLQQCACAYPLLTDATLLGEHCIAAVRAANLQAVAQLFHSFPATALGPGGVTASVLLAESHMCIHTWPEQKAATLDVYVCNFGGDHSAKAEQLMAALCALLRPGYAHTQRVLRGVGPAQGQA